MGRFLVGSRHLNSFVTRFEGRQFKWIPWRGTFVQVEPQRESFCSHVTITKEEEPTPIEWISLEDLSELPVKERNPLHHGSKEHRHRVSGTGHRCCRRIKRFSKSVGRNFFREFLAFCTGNADDIDSGVSTPGFEANESRRSDGEDESWTSIEVDSLIDEHSNPSTLGIDSTSMSNDDGETYFADDEDNVAEGCFNSVQLESQDNPNSFDPLALAENLETCCFLLNLIEISKMTSLPDFILDSLDELKSNHDLECEFLTNPELFVSSFLNDTKVIVLATLLDKDLFGENLDESEKFLPSRFIKLMYEVREFLGHGDLDYGYKNLAVSESPDISTGFFKYLRSMVSTSGENDSLSLKQLIDTVCDRVFGFFSVVSNFVAGVFTRATNFVKDMLNKMLCIVLDSILEHLTKPAVQVALSILVSFLMFCFLYIAGLLTKMLFDQIIDSFVRSDPVKEFDPCAVAEGDSDRAIGCCLGIISSISAWTLSATDVKRIKDKLSMLTLLASGGTVLVCASKWIFCLLPIAIKDALLFNFGTRKQLEEYNLELWKSQVLMLLKVHTVPAVLDSAEFLEKLNSTLAQGQVLIGKLTEPTNKSLFVRFYADLVRIKSNLVQLRSGNGTRPVPFSLHLAGIPGVGKTTVSTQIVSDLLNNTSSIYFVPTSNFWNGFLNQKVIIFDEFLGGPLQAKQERAEQYLHLVSSEPFQPDLATVDNPLIGIKGSFARPDLVMTINNTRYDYVREINNDALQRRRNFVIEVGFHPEAKKAGPNKIDVNQYSDDEITNLAWAQFVVLPGQNPPHGDIRKVASRPMNYPELREFLRREYAEHQRLSRLLSANLVNSFAEDENPSDVMLGVVREQFGFPDKPVSLLDHITNFMGGLTARAEGKHRNKTQGSDVHRHLCLVCQKYFEHDECVSCSFPCCGRPFVPKEFALFAQGEEVPLTVWKSDHTRDELVMRGAGRHMHRCESCGRIFTHKHTMPTTHLVTICRPDCPGLYVEQDILNEVTDKDRVDSFNRGRIDAPDFDLTCDPVSTYEKFKKIMYTPTAKLLACVFGGLGLVTSLGYILFRKKLSTEPILTFHGTAESKPPQKKKKGGRRKNIHKRVNDTREGGNLGEEHPFGMGSRSGACVLTIGDIVMNCMCIKDRWLLTYSHSLIRKIDDCRYTFIVKNGEKAHVSMGVKVFPFEIELSHIIVDVNLDVCLVHVGSRDFPVFSNRIPKFLTAEEVSLFKHGMGSLTVNNTCHSVKIVRNDRELTYKTLNGGHSFTIEPFYAYLMNSEFGYCGSVLTCMQEPYSGRYLGLHVAGSVNKSTSRSAGYSSVLTSEDLEEMFELFEGTDQMDVPPGEAVCESFIDDSLKDIQMLDLPNLEFVQRDSRFVFLPRFSKIKRSSLSPYLESKPLKAPPILSRFDPRSGGKDPVIEMIKDTCSSEHPILDSKIIDDIGHDLYTFYSQRLNWPISKRYLTMDEAVFGVPGLLKGINFSTSPGYPLIEFREKSGKTDFAGYDSAGKPYITEFFRELVVKRLEHFRSGGLMDHLWIGYLKDELLKKSKIETCRTRLIYCGSMIDQVVFRIHYGSLLCAFNSSYEHTPLAIGVNQYSYDMNMIFKYLDNKVDNCYIAGDYKSFDKRVQPSVQRAVYTLIGKLSLEIAGNDWKTYNQFVHTQIDSPALIGGLLFKPICNHMSGCFYTTIVNCLVNDFYMRYCFKRLNPELYFDDFVKAKFCGDDNIMSVRPGCKFGPDDLRSVMKELGQEYTSDTKESFVSEFRKFEECTFLGAHPRRLKGGYTGALRKETLEECIHWTRDRDLSLIEKLTAMVDLASQWDEDYFNGYVSQIIEGLNKLGMNCRLRYSYEQLQDITANRTVGNGCTFIDEDNYYEGVGLVMIDFDEDAVAETGTRGLTTMHTDEMQRSDSANEQNNVRSGIGEEYASISFGTESVVKRGAFKWSSEAYGAIVGSVSAPAANFTVPKGLLDLGNTTNIQNMPFKNFIYWNGCVEVTFQVNGSPFQKGLLCAYFYPMTISDSELPAPELMLTMQHVLLQPNVNNTGKICIPFRFPRNVINTFTLEGSEDKQECLGRIHIRVLSPLTENTDCTVTVYSSFPNSNFIIPRPQEVSMDEEAIGEGQSFSSSTTNNYQVHDVIGSMPIQTSAKVKGGDQDISPKTHAQISMDNPPLNSGAVPQMPQYSGLAKTQGVEPTVAMQLHPCAMNREHREIMFDPREMSIEYLCNKPSLLCVFNWSTSQVADTQLTTVSLNSDFPVSTGHGPTLLSCILGQAMFWRADLVFDVKVVRTRFHSGRLRATIGYGVPKLAASDQSNYYNHVLDFNDDVSNQVFRINWNSPTEFLRTFEGIDAPDPVQNYSLGTLGFYVANTLVTNLDDQETVQVLVFLHAENVSLAVPRPIPFYNIDVVLRNTSIDALLYTPPADEADAVAEGGLAAPVTNSEQENKLETITPIDTTETANDTNQRGRPLQIGSKFEFRIASIMDILKRGVRINKNDPTARIQYDEYFDADEGLSETVPPYWKTVEIRVKPLDNFKSLYCCWGGSIRYRIYLRTSTKSTYECSAFFIPSMIDGTTSIADPLEKTNTFRKYDAPATGKKVRVVCRYGGGARAAHEVLYPVRVGENYIDVNVPFQSHFNFLSYQPNATNFFTNECAGTLTISISGLENKELPKPTVYIMLGDDFGYGVFRAPRELSRSFPSRLYWEGGPHVLGGYWLNAPQ